MSARGKGAGGSRGGSGGGSRKRYAAAVEKGDNAWRREWSSFISGVDMKRVRDGTTAVSLRARADLATAGTTTTTTSSSSNSDTNNINSSSSAGGGPSFDAAPASFSYLFSSAADRRVERDQKKKRSAEEAAARRNKGKPLKEVKSKHQLAMEEAQRRGLKLEGMTRKAVRDFLQLSRTKEQEAAQQQAKEVKLYELMDTRVAWYQQGPHPIDLIAERLVARKAAKKGRKIGLLKYNYLIPHPSWMAARARRRREGVLVGLGKRFTFDEATGQAMDPLRNVPVDLTKVSMLLDGGCVVPPPPPKERRDGEEEEEEEEEDEEEGEVEVDAASDGVDGGDGAAKDGAAAPSSTRFLDGVLLVDPTRALTTFSRAVVRNKAAAEAIKRANLTTNYISGSLIMGPSIGLDSDKDDGDDGEVASREEEGEESGRARSRETRSRPARAAGTADKKWTGSSDNKSGRPEKRPARAAKSGPPVKRRGASGADGPPPAKSARAERPRGRK